MLQKWRCLSSLKSVERTCSESGFLGGAIDTKVRNKPEQVHPHGISFRPKSNFCSFMWFDMLAGGVRICRSPSRGLLSRGKRLPHIQRIRSQILSDSAWDKCCHLYSEKILVSTLNLTSGCKQMRRVESSDTKGVVYRYFSYLNSCASFCHGC